jgi:hypothetical protein
MALVTLTAPPQLLMEVIVMIDMMQTRVGRLSVETNGATIQLVSDAYTLAAHSQTHTHRLTIEQCHVLIHALARAIGGAAVEVQL